LAGYFYPYDQQDVAGSNRMNLLYIDDNEGLNGQTNQIPTAGSQNATISSLLNTLAHEYQHLIHYGRRSGSEIVYNEGCSEEASILNGYQNRANTLYYKNTNVSMFSWPSPDETNGDVILGAYERG